MIYREYRKKALLELKKNHILLTQTQEIFQNRLVQHWNLLCLRLNELS